MRRPVIASVALLGVCLAFAPEASSAQGPDRTPARTSAHRVDPGPAVDPQCTGTDFTPLANDVEVADQLMAGQLTMPPFGPTTLPKNPTWTENPFNALNWVFQFQTLRWADPLRRVGLATGNQAMLDRYTELWADWVHDNPLKAPRTRYSWYDMSDGLRAVGLVCMSSSLPTRPSWLDAAIALHAKVLSDPKRYASLNNHGQFQNIGLLALGCHRNVAAWRNLAASRMNSMIKTAVDSQGVTNEGSMLYQVLNYGWNKDVEQLLLKCGLTPGPLFKRIDKMPAVTAYATQPNRYLVPFGDTSTNHRATSIAGTPLEYAVTQGASGPKPAATFAVFNRGYAFSRSGWYDTQTAAQQSLASMRFGQSKATAPHGHLDAGDIAYYSLGSPILWQPGIYGGEGGPKRTYVLSNRAHNTLDITGAKYDQTAKTPLVAKATNAGADLVTIQTKVLSGALWQRTMVHAKAAGFLVVDDRVTQSKRRTVVQRWQLGSDRLTTTQRARVTTSGPGANATIVWAGTQPKTTVVKGQLKPLLGWRSEIINQFIPAPTVEARATGKTVRLTALIIPRAANASPTAVKLLRSSDRGKVRTVDVQSGDKAYRVTFTQTSAKVVQIAMPTARR